MLSRSRSLSLSLSLSLSCPGFFISPPPLFSRPSQVKSVAEQQRDDLVGLGTCLLTVAARSPVQPSTVEKGQVPGLASQTHEFLSKPTNLLCAAAGPRLPGGRRAALLARGAQPLAVAALQAARRRVAVCGGVLARYGRTHHGLRGEKKCTDYVGV